MGLPLDELLEVLDELLDELEVLELDVLLEVELLEEELPELELEPELVPGLSPCAPQALSAMTANTHIPRPARIPPDPVVVVAPL